MCRLAAGNDGVPGADILEPLSVRVAAAVLIEAVERATAVGDLRLAVGAPDRPGLGGTGSVLTRRRCSVAAGERRRLREGPLRAKLGSDYRLTWSAAKDDERAPAPRLLLRDETPVCRDS